MSSHGSGRGGPTRTGRSRTRSSSEDNLLDCSHSSARLALQQEVLPGAVKSGSLESLLRGEYTLLDSSTRLALQQEELPGAVDNGSLESLLRGEYTLLDSSTRMALQQEELPGTVKSWSLESLLRGGLC